MRNILTLMLVFSFLIPFHAFSLLCRSRDVASALLWTVYIGSVLYKNWRALRGSDRPGQIPFSLIARVAIFSFVCVVGIGATMVFLANVSYFAGNIIISLSQSLCRLLPDLIVEER